MQLGVLFGSQLLGGFGTKLAVLGATVGGSLLLNGKKEPTGKLNDLRVSSSSYGRGIPIVMGTMRTTGNMIWCTEFEEEKNYLTAKGKRKGGGMGKKKSKKGKATETYEYFANFAMGLCAGPVDSIIRIWADNNLIYDKLNRDDEDDPLVEIGFSRDDSSGGGKADMKNPSRKKGHDGDSGRFAFRFYTGSEEQMPDPFVVEKQGENAVAFRGLSYLFFEKFALADFGNRIPTITAEVSVKSQRKPIVRVFENMEPKELFTASGADPYDGMQVDATRHRFYQQAVGTDGITYLRTFDLDSFKEIKRTPIGPGSAVTALPQTVPRFGDVNDMVTVNSWTWVGVAGNGDLIFRIPIGNNYNPIAWVDPLSLSIKYLFGYGGNLGGSEPYDMIGQAYSAFPMVMNGSDENATTKVVTAVRTIDGHVAFFDDETHKVVVFDKLGSINGVKSVQPGAIGSEDAVLMVGNNIYTLTGNLYSAPVNEPVIPAGEMEPLAPTIVDFKTLYRWPPADEDDVFISDIVFSAYCAGARAIVVLGTISSGSAKFPNGIYAIKLDPETKEELWRKKLDGVDGYGGDLGVPTYLGGNTYCYLTGEDTGQRQYVQIDWRQETYNYFSVPNEVVPVPYTGQYFYSDLDALLYMARDVGDDADRYSWVLASVNKQIQVPVAVSDVCREMVTRCGIPTDRIDLRGLTNDEEITGYSIENPTPARQVLEELANVFMFDVIESDNILKFKTRGGESLVTIPQADLGVVESDFGSDNEYYVETRTQEIELPERVNVSFINPKENYETGTQHYKRPLKPLSVMNSKEVLEVTLNMAMKPLRAKTLAQRILFAAWGERTSHQYALPREYMIYEPGDVITVELENGERFTDRLTDVEIGADSSMRVSAVSNIAAAYTMETTVDDPGGIIAIPGTSRPTVRPAILNVPYLSDEDVNDAGEITYYWGALAYGPGYRFGALMSQLPGDSEAETEEYTSYDALWGSVQGTVPAPVGPPEITDLNTRLTLSPAFEFNEPSVRYVWESIPDHEWPSEKNMIIIGDEVIQFKNVEINDNGTVTISHLIRGAKGTGHACATHVGGETWVLVLPRAIETAGEILADLNTPKWFTIQSGSLLPPAATRVTKVVNGATRKPWQVGDVRRVNATAGITINWKRATRYGGAFRNGSGTVALNEESERYELFVLKAPYDPKTWDPENEDLYVHHVENISTASHQLTTAVLAGLGLTNKSNLHVVIYQLSAVVGRGFPRGISLPYTALTMI